MKEEYITIFAVIPKEIYQTKDLSPEDKLIAERLVYLCKKEGYSWVTNKSLLNDEGINILSSILNKFNKIMDLLNVYIVTKHIVSQIEPFI